MMEYLEFVLLHCSINPLIQSGNPLTIRMNNRSMAGTLFLPDAGVIRGSQPRIFHYGFSTFGGRGESAQTGGGVRSRPTHSLGAGIRKCSRYLRRQPLEKPR